MNRLLTCTAVGLIMGLTPAMAQTEPPMDETQNPPAMQEPMEPGAPAEVTPTEPSDPSDPAEPIPGQSMAPDEASPPSDAAEAPTPISPDQSAEASPDSPQFLTRQESDDWLASSLIGKAVVNAENESIGHINDLVTGEDGQIVAALIGTGGFLGLGEKEVALRYEDLRIVRDEDNDVTVMANVTGDTLASAPDFEKLSEQEVTVGKGDREDLDQDNNAGAY